jgi:hypothetical protein
LKLFFSLVIPAILVIIIFSGCNSSTEKPAVEVDSTSAAQNADTLLLNEFKNLFYKQVQGLKAKNAGDYLSTFKD